MDFHEENHGFSMASSIVSRQVPELNGLVGRALGLASGCARRPPDRWTVIDAETHGENPGNPRKTRENMQNTWNM